MQYSALNSLCKLNSLASTFQECLAVTIKQSTSQILFFGHLIALSKYLMFPCRAILAYLPNIGRLTVAPPDWLDTAVFP